MRLSVEDEVVHESCSGRPSIKGPYVLRGTGTVSPLRALHRLHRVPHCESGSGGWVLCEGHSEGCVEHGEIRLARQTSESPREAHPGHTSQPPSCTLLHVFAQWQSEGWDCNCQGVGIQWPVEFICADTGSLLGRILPASVDPSLRGVVCVPVVYLWCTGAWAGGGREGQAPAAHW